MEEFLRYFLTAIIGLLLGSFFTASATRILYYVYGPGRKDPRRWLQFFTRPSFCFHCEKRIKLIHLIPVIGYFLTRGRCKACNERVGWPTLLGEIFPGLLFPYLIFSGTSFMGAFFTILLIGHLYISIVTDYNFYLLDHENALFIFLWAGALVLEKSSLNFVDIKSNIYTFGVVFLIMFLLFIIGRARSLGFGDVVLASIISFPAGFPWSLVLFQVSALGSIVYVFLIKKDRSAPSPFGVFIALGFYCTTILQATWNLLTGE